MTFCETDVEETCFDETVEESVVEICEGTFAHGNTECLDRDYNQISSGGRGGLLRASKR